MHQHLVVAAIIALCLAGVSQQQHVRPNISEQFYTRTQASVKEPGRTYTYEGEWAHDLTGERQMRQAVLHSGEIGPSLDEQRLFFYREHTYYYYKFEEEEVDSCVKYLLNGSMPTAWGWVSLAAYAGTKTYEGHVLDLWRYRTATYSREIGVWPELPNTPVYYGINETTVTTHVESTMVMTDFNPSTPPASMFEIPQTCQPHTTNHLN